MKKLNFTSQGFALMLFIVLFTNTYGQVSESVFKNPPTEYRPKTWMHAMSGNMSKAGITKDFEAMAKAGLGGLLLFNVTQGIPYGKVTYASAEHIDMLAFAAAEAARVGLQFGIHNCDGWSSSGGPWVKPEDAMKMVVSSEMVVSGSDNMQLQLPLPTVREGFYSDIVTLAYPALEGDIKNKVQPKVTASDKGFNVAIATDGKMDAAAPLKKMDGDSCYLQFDYGTAQPIRTASCISTDRDVQTDLYASNDGENFRLITRLRKTRTGKGEWVSYDHVDMMPHRYYRLMFSGNANIKEATLSSLFLIDDLFGRTAMARTEIGDFKPIGEPQANMVIDAATIKDISKYVDANGKFSGSLPKGQWTIMRFGYTATGAFNHPASDQGRGLEIDKLSRSAMKLHYDALVKKLVVATDKLPQSALQYVEIDSYEMGGQNWTESFAEQFQKRFGYDPLLFMPLLAGKFVNNASTSEAVLQDWRALTSDLMTENYYGYFQELCHADGLKTYVENYGFGPLNDLEVGSKADMPMGEFWMNRPITQVAAPISAAHIYGRKIISAESFTSTPEINWKGNPAMAKISGDKAWALGINEFMFHRFAHQANTHVAPGMTMNRWGFHMDRTQTWWYNAGAAWFSYVARGSYLLQQGVPVSDLLMFVGDGAPNGTVGRNQMKPSLPPAYTYDNVNADVLINRVKVSDKRLTLPEGGSYKALILHNSAYMQLATLKRVKELADAGVVIIGAKPKALVGYGHTTGDMQRFNQYVSAIWGSKHTYSNYNFASIFNAEGILPNVEIVDRPDIDMAHRRVGEEDIYFTYNPDSVATSFTYKIAGIGKTPEFWDATSGSVTAIAQYYQQDGFTMVPMHLQPEQSIFLVLRKGKEKLQRIASGLVSPHVSYQYNAKGEILAVTDNPGTYNYELANGTKKSFAVAQGIAAKAIDAPWQVSFDKAGGYSGTLRFDKLIDWKDHALDSIKYFSGTAIYRTSFTMAAAALHANTIWCIDLGKVSIAARVILNGKDVGVAWMAPFVIDVTDALQAGENQLVLEVTNLWSNKLIGDERYPAHDGGYKLDGAFPKTTMPSWYTNNEPLPPGPRTTFTTAPFYKKNDQLESSGLIGPVVLKPKFITILQ